MHTTYHSCYSGSTARVLPCASHGFRDSVSLRLSPQALLKMNSVTLVAQLIQNTVILSTAVELGARWRELAEKMGKLSSAQIADYEAPHRGKSRDVGAQVSFTAHTENTLISWHFCRECDE